MDGSSCSSCDGDKKVNYPTFVDKRVIFVRFFMGGGGGQHVMATCELFEMYNVWGCLGYGYVGLLSVGR